MSKRPNYPLIKSATHSVSDGATNSGDKPTARFAIVNQVVPANQKR